MSIGVKMKSRKARKIKRKYEITSIDKIPIIKEKMKHKKNSTIGLRVSEDMKNKQNSLDSSKFADVKKKKEIKK